LLFRLDTNLDSIVLKDFHDNNDFSLSKDAVGLYEGFDKNTITMFFTQEHLRNPQLREDFIAILLHELTHACYTIKKNDIYQKEEQIFGVYEKMIDGNICLVSGDDIYMEPIVNYVSSCIFGKRNSCYVIKTSNMFKLTEIIDMKLLVSSAFYSDNQKFRKLFENMGQGAYEYFTEGMKWLGYRSKYGYTRGMEIMNNFFNGNIPTVKKKLEFKEVTSLKKASDESDQNNEEYGNKKR